MNPLSKEDIRNFQTATKYFLLHSPNIFSVLRTKSRNLKLKAELTATKTIRENQLLVQQQKAKSD